MRQYFSTTSKGGFSECLRDVLRNDVAAHGRAPSANGLTVVAITPHIGGNTRCINGGGYDLPTLTG